VESSEFIVLKSNDNVATARRTMKSGAAIRLNGTEITLRQTIPGGHKVALADVNLGQELIKYGQNIGFAKAAIETGDWVHTHNVELKEVGRDYDFCADFQPWAVRQNSERSFQGFARPNGKAGSRNYIGVISSVNCSASVSRYVANHFRTNDLSNNYPNVDGVVAFTHKGGCSYDPNHGHVLLQRVIAGMARHPNIGGYLLVGLGCEVNQVPGLVEAYKLDQLQEGEQPPRFLTIQQTGGVRKTVESAIKAVEEMLPKVNAQQRTPQPVSKLTLAMNCGGSDSNSGVSANPALGVASDELVRQGATSVFGETTEIYGAEHLLTRRAASREVGEKLISQIRWWEDHTKMFGSTIDNNPSPGNKDGGLTTIFEKSLGAVAKAGQAPLSAVYDYAEPITSKGLCFMDTPGNDPVSMTGLISGGCNVGVFTTGRGSVYGCKPSPCIKVATNTPLYNWMEEDMDVNAGKILDGTETLEQVGQRIYDKIISVASGEKTKSELAGMGDEEFAPWMLGPTL
jgi:altronate hydrolase